MFKRWARWILRGEEPPPESIVGAASALILELRPYGKSIPRGHYLAAWDSVRGTEEGDFIIGTLHNNLVTAMQAVCPDHLKTSMEATALWNAQNDGVKRALLDLTLQAVKGSALDAPPPKQKKTPQLVAGGSLKGAQYA